MTLLELTEIIEKRKKMAKIPTAKQLREMGGTIVVSKEFGVKYDVTVYANGYILYRRDGKSTVFPFFKCLESYVYASVMEGREETLGFEYFKDKEFYIRMVLEGERRLEHNANEAERRKFSAYEDVFLELQKVGRRQDTFLEKMIRAEWLEEQLNILTARQREGLELLLFERESKTDIAKRWGVSPASVTDTIRRAVLRLQKSINEEDFF